MRLRLADPESANYLNTEVFLNNIKLVLVNSSTEAVLGVAQVDSSGNYVAPSGVANTVKFAIIDGATSGNNTLVSAVSTKKIRVHSLFAVAAGTVNVRFESGADGTALTGQMNLVANTGFALPWNPEGWFETAASALLNMELSAAISVDGSLSYTEV